jgi:2-polyprenyl-3-methyl-5-hydroxy-6-metoxy-1,4-benzoquinol methylase
VTVYADLVGRHGLAESHRHLIASVPSGALVLDVGCAEGYLAEALRARGSRGIVGVEAVPAAAEQARRVYDDVVVGDVEDPAVREQVSGGFDVALFGDVLEHLRDPLTVLRWAAERSARVVVSAPNIAHWTARRELLRGRWRYADHGLFDRTHLRFFTRASVHELVRDAGLRVERESFASAPLPLEGRLPALSALRARVVSLRPELFALQIVLTCAPAAAR